MWVVSFTTRPLYPWQWKFLLTKSKFDTRFRCCQPNYLTVILPSFKILSNIFGVSYVIFVCGLFSDFFCLNCVPVDIERNKTKRPTATNTVILCWYNSGANIGLNLFCGTISDEYITSHQTRASGKWVDHHQFCRGIIISSLRI